MRQTQFAPPEHTRTDFEIGLVFEDQRTGDLRRVVYADDRVVLVRDRDGNSTLEPRETFLAQLDERYRRRPDADPSIEGGPYDRLLATLATYEDGDGRKAAHKADALREALGLLGESAVDTGDPDVSGDDPSVAFEEIAGIGPAKAAKLRASGFRTEGDVRAASDEAVLAVPGVGPENLAAIREFVA